ncbi:MAG: O-antigen polymerase [Parcubacteria group bacterium Gr01-1014_18]|nr:MAG: O-antigen polymerase [Parcubacteria group bacterium Greene0416_36]TSC81167.1 MAG: O-antigen polymerase [Parcubacteria group bacterium Gr01-1014_18]TSC99164.1 MAG: O-antigen polymerase [Parcubacteria group bacterium Greene1014_20]TSD07478.1 MAG: O-antigen polymerase [Parcubacteria group bacterium Greene0714_2]
MFNIPMTLLESMILVLFCVFLIRERFLLDRKGKGVSQYALTFPVLLFLLSATVAVILSPDLRAALGQWKAYFIEPILFFWVFIKTIRTEKNIRGVFITLGILSFYLALYGLLQYAFSWIPAPWNQGDLRITSFYPYPNALSLVVTPILGAYLVLFARNIPLFSSFFLDRFWKITVLAFTSAALFLSGSDGGALALMAGMCSLGAFILMREKNRFSKNYFLFIPALIVFLVFAGARISVDPSTDVRHKLWIGSWKMIADHPIEGFGLGGFSRNYEKYKLPEHTEILLYPHQLFFNFWIEMGLLGMVSFILLVVFFCVFCWPSIRAEKSPFILPVFIMMLVLLAHGMVDVAYFKNDLAVLFWVVYGLGMTSKT